LEKIQTTLVAQQGGFIRSHLAGTWTTRAHSCQQHQYMISICADAEAHVETPAQVCAQPT